MKRLFCALFVFALLLSGCARKAPVPEATPPAAEPSAPVSEPELITEPEPVSELEPTPKPKPVPESEPDPLSALRPSVRDSIRILAVGNSFSIDSMQYLWQMLEQAGYREIVLGNLHYPGCKLLDHLNFASKDAAEYVYYKNTSGAWQKTEGFRMSAGLQDESWDIVTFQQGSAKSGIAASYEPSLSMLLKYVRPLVPETAVFLWNMTWAYQQDSTQSAFYDYNRDQMTMYRGIIESVESKILPNADIASVIPVGTAVQNLRTSFLGDTLTRDGYHLSYDAGRYTAALSWCCAISGADPTEIVYNPKPDAITTDMAEAAREAVSHALASPMEVTPSTFLSGSTKVEFSSVYERDKAFAALKGKNLDDYTLLEWTHLSNAYWNGSSGPGVFHPSSGSSTAEAYICSDRKYSISELPAGTLFFCDNGWRFRPEVFPDAIGKNVGARPEQVSDAVFELTETFLNGNTYVAWNVSTNPREKITGRYDEAATHLRIYVPKK